ncbi:hypothetical protein ABPG75_008151 [Micractinium tetrahymenae]
MPSSGQGGPCCHCGTRNSCCWRRGPPSKPVLCNACGSRYLVKRSLEGYQPLQTRREAGVKQQTSEGSKAGVAAGARRATAPAAGRVSKAKRAALKRSIDSDAWHSEAEDSQASDTPSLYMTDDSAASRRASARLAGAGGLPGAAAAAAAPSEAQAAAGEREPSVRVAAAASRLKLSYITSQSQLAQELGCANLSSIASAFLASSLWLKPRKPLVVKVAAVW